MADDVATRAFNYYVSQGLAPHQAAAMVGHMMAESGGSTTIREGGGTGPGYGAFQWTTPERKQGLYNYANSGTGVQLDPNALETQLGYSLYELDHGEKAAGQKLYAAQNYGDAVNAGMDYLRPSGYTPDNPQAGNNYAGRYNLGAQYAGVDPMPGGGGDPSQQPGGGLLSPAGQYAQSAPGSMATTPGQLAADDLASAKAVAAAPDPYAAAGASLAKIGTGLMASQKPQAAPMKLVEAANTPQAQAQGNPDFVQQLAQMRLLKRQQGGFG